MLLFALAFFVSLMFSFLVIRCDHKYHNLVADYDTKSIQKFHELAVPRIGGVAIFLGILIASLVGIYIQPNLSYFGVLVLLCSFVLFLAGAVEDLTKKVGIKQRLYAAMFSSLLGGLILDGWLVRFDLEVLDALIAIPLISIIFTCFAISGVANAYNIIDGYNGLSGVVAIISLLGLTYVSIEVGDPQITNTALIIIGSILGFLFWNFPRGLIFLGDGGAYLIGFMVAELSVLLVARNSLVSPWFPFLLNIYPIFETIFSIYRKKIKRGISPGIPDGLHLHMLIYKRLVRLNLFEKSIKQKILRNSLTSPYLWLLSSFAVIPAVIFWKESVYLIIFSIIFIITYIIVYKKIIRFKLYKWLIIRNKL